MSEEAAFPHKVLAVIPCLNEKAHLKSVVHSLLEDATALKLHIVIADGGSTDGTLAIATDLVAQHPNVTLLHNEKRIQSAALNKAVQSFGSDAEFLIRVDAHCAYPRNYCQSLLNAQRESKADAVVVSMTAVGSDCFQRAVATAQNSRLGNGGSAHRLAGQGRFVDHGHHALIRLDAFRAIGGYDENFSHNEDAEFDLRLSRAGYQIWLSGKTFIAYFPRSTVASLWRQYFNYGQGRAKTLLKHKKRPRLRQSLPLLVAPAAALAPLGLVHAAFVAPLFLWAALCLSYGLLLGARTSSRCNMMAGFAAMIMHAGWSFGFLWLLVKRLKAFFLWKASEKRRPSHKEENATAIKRQP